MNASINRVGLAVATLAVIVTVGGAYVADGYLSARGAASDNPGHSNDQRSLIPRRPANRAARTGVRPSGPVAQGHPRHQSGIAASAQSDPRHSAGGAG